MKHTTKVLFGLLVFSYAVSAEQGRPERDRSRDKQYDSPRYLKDEKAAEAMPTDELKKLQNAIDALKLYVAALERENKKLAEENRKLMTALAKLLDEKQGK